MGRGQRRYKGDKWSWKKYNKKKKKSLDFKQTKVLIITGGDFELTI